MAAVKSVFPSSQVTPNCVNSYPIRVVVEARHGDGTTEEIWRGDQRNLFSKYAAKRRQAIDEIVKGLGQLKARL